MLDLLVAEESESEPASFAESSGESEESSDDDETLSNVTNSGRTTAIRGDMSDERAAVKIQAAYRGYRVRNS